jgi:hypothetical protein
MGKSSESAEETWAVDLPKIYYEGISNEMIKTTICLLTYSSP